MQRQEKETLKKKCSADAGMSHIRRRLIKNQQN